MIEIIISENHGYMGTKEKISTSAQKWAASPHREGDAF